MALRSRVERIERRRAKQEASTPAICPACGKPTPPPLTPYMRGDGWSDVDEACQVCLPEDRIVLTLVGVTERPPI